MPHLGPLATARRRFNELSATVGQARELARIAADRAEALRQQLVAETQRREETEAQLDGQLRAMAAQLERIGGELDTLRASGHEREGLQSRFRSDVITGLRHIHADEAQQRRRLRELRRTEEYERAFTDPDPLVSVLIPTYSRLEELRSRAIPSILAQDHRNLEIIIVGDRTTYGVAEIVAGFERAPIRFSNLPLRGPYPEETRRRWLVAGAPPFNEAMAMAKGRWVAPFADDDAMRPQHIRTLLAAARRDRLEFVYGLVQQHFEGDDRVLGSFPPRFADIGLQAALLHGGLSIFELELADAEFDVPNDWARIERMMRAGVRIGMVEEVLADYFPGGLFRETDECAGGEPG
jgi:hypothetical protein